MIKKMLITGANGFVGSHLVRKSKEQGYEVHAAVRETSKIDDISSLIDKFVYLDYENLSSIKEILQEEKYNYIVHAAALTSAKQEETMFRVNVDYTINLIQAAFDVDIPPQRLIYLSSLAAVGPLAYDSQAGIQDDSPQNPVTMYGRSKSASEKLIAHYYSDKNITILRPTAVYGPRERDLYLLFKTMYKGLDLYIGRSPQKLTFIYVEDLVQAILKSSTDVRKGFFAYNLTDGCEYSRYAMSEIFKSTLKKRMWRLHVPESLVRNFAKLSQRMYRNSPKVPVIYPERLNELTAPSWVCNIDGAIGEIGYEPQYDLERGLRETLLWYKEQRWL